MGTLPTSAELLTPRPNFKVDLAGKNAEQGNGEEGRDQRKLGHFFKGNNTDSTAPELIARAKEPGV